MHLSQVSTRKQCQMKKYGVNTIITTFVFKLNYYVIHCLLPTQLTKFIIVMDKQVNMWKGLLFSREIHLVSKHLRIVLIQCSGAITNLKPQPRLIILMMNLL